MYAICKEIHNRKRATEANLAKGGAANKKITPEIIVQLQAKYDSGMNCPEIAKKTGFGLTTVNRYIKNKRPNAGQFRRKDGFI